MKPCIHFAIARVSALRTRCVFESPKTFRSNRDFSIRKQNRKQSGERKKLCAHQFQINSEDNENDSHIINLISYVNWLRFSFFRSL